MAQHTKSTKPTQSNRSPRRVAVKVVEPSPSIATRPAVIFPIVGIGCSAGGLDAVE
ncbi:MAG: hypothetical protein FD187_1954 [bacterium]|nr:MAG: hypothetical protein FD142_1654 [bacterium]KAF0148531.1 MAG: hypothetical protein FD187_1954 [bacterium]KAF0167255.1 MAG: hypothetical protein FD158_2402 [bacterium]